MIGIYYIYTLHPNGSYVPWITLNPSTDIEGDFFNSIPILLVEDDE